MDIEGIWVICAKTPFLHTFDVLIKMFANSLKPTNTETDHVYCFEIQLMKSGVVV